MVFDAPLVKAEQHSSIRVEKLTKVGMLWRSCCLAEQRLVPPEAPGHILHPDDRPRAFHCILRRPNRYFHRITVDLTRVVIVGRSSTTSPSANQAFFFGSSPYEVHRSGAERRCDHCASAGASPKLTESPLPACLP